MSLMQLCFQMPGLLRVSTIPMEAMQETNCFQYWQTTLERQEVRNCLSCRWCFSLLGSIVALDCWPTFWSIRDLCKACQAMEQQAFPQVVAQLRTDPSHERTLVPPRGFALHRLQSTLLLGFWTSLLCPTLLSLILSCLSCASMLLNQQRILAPLVSLKSVPAKNSFVRTLQLENVFRQIPRCLVGASFLVQRLLVWPFPRISARKYYAHEAHTFG